VSASPYDKRRLILALDAYLRSRFEARSAARVSELAQRLGVSREHISRLYRSVTGEPLRRLMRERQVERAEHLLRATSYPTSEIAALSAFGTEMTLRRAFAAFHRMTPDEYRQKITK
jgi:AraC-like DNA-binding protein